ncbi:hypothetical protein GOBAR_AA32190 [Gossypium barbadense]|uniref:Uncharacterized protein n=1 Tax=Gossypium barbadense TaxID=3634 RepID=A0A2P5QUW7_GOSBA|nr:hypothetical protein GOBAR_DD24729 [Gossypium barbadense]PPR88495.1 hypothetical protein GOBAR_AA32190 [Gossypium barbadense]
MQMSERPSGGYLPTVWDPELIQSFTPLCTNSDGKFKERLSEDPAGLLSLYEASHLGVHEEDVLDETKAFSTKHLKLAMDMLELEKDLAQQSKESLEVPLYWRLPRMEARNFINIYQRDENKKLALSEFAKLDFNLLQSVYLQELKELAEWWKRLKMKDKLPFARDRMVECYFLAMGSVPDPKFSKCRRNLTKFGSLATILDDVYDIYGQCISFINAQLLWDLEATVELPEYMNVCYKAMYNHVNEMVEDALNTLGLDILPYIKDQVRIQYANQENTRYMPTTLEAYFKNAWISIGIAVGLAYVFLVEMERGETTSSTQCYMIQGVSAEEARDHIKDLICDSWKKLNKLVAQSSLPTGFAETALAMVRCVQQMYQFGDWFGVQSKANKDCQNSSLFNCV